MISKLRQLLLLIILLMNSLLYNLYRGILKVTQINITLYYIVYNMSSKKEEFIHALIKAVRESKKAAKSKTGGDPGTMVSASVDGRYGFAKKFKKYSLNKNGKYTFKDVPVTLDSDNGIHIDVLEGTNIQSHSKKIAMYRKFSEVMEEQEYNCGLNVNTYSY